MGRKNKGKKDGDAAGDQGQNPQQQQPQATPSAPQNPGPSSSGNVPGGEQGKKKKGRGDKPVQQQQEQRDPHERGPAKQQQQQQKGERPPQQQGQRGPLEQGQRGPQEQGQRRPQEQGDQGSRGQQQQGGHQQGQRGPQPKGQQQQGQGGPQQQPQGFRGQQQEVQGGPQQGLQGPRQRPQQQPQGFQGQQKHGQGGPQQHGGQRGPQQQQGGPPQQSQQYGQWQQHQQVQRGPQQQQQPQGAWGQSQGGQGLQQQQQNQRGPQQQQGQRGTQQQQGQRGPQQQQGQRGPQQQQDQRGYQQQQGQRYQQQQQGQRAPQQQQQQQQQRQSSLSSSSSSVSLSGSTSSKGSIPRGTLGRKDTVEVNYLNINMDKMPDKAYHYDVDITPDRPKKFMRIVFDQFNRQFFSNIFMAFDGKKSCYTATKLPVGQIQQEVEIDDSGSRRITFQITVKETQDMEIDLKSLKSYYADRVYDKPMRALQCLEVVLASPCHNKGVRVGRSFFKQPDEDYNLGDGYEMWTGLYQAAILGDTPFLNVDISHKSFPKEGSLVDYIRNNIYNSNLNYALEGRNLDDLFSFLRPINIIYEPPQSFGQFPKTYKVNSVTRESANNLSFTLDDGTRLTVAEYFASKGYPLKHPNLNCLHVGSTVRNIYVPIECCKIPPGQATNKKDGENQVRQMIRFAATSTDVRKAKIMSLLRYFNHNTNERIINFGIQIGNAFKQVPMRILDSPMVEYLNRETIRPIRGAWRMEGRTQFLLTVQAPPAKDGHTWAVIYNRRSRIRYDSIDKFARMVLDLSKKLNMFLSSKYEIVDFDNIGKKLDDYKKKNFDLVFVVLPQRGTTYAEVKQQAELRIGQLTQCIKEITIERKCDMQTVTNILLKVNGKLNGTNHKINADRNSVPLQNVMFLGADVTHPSPDQSHIPSVVGVAASHDANGACYNMQYRLQRSTVENIEDMESIFMQHMKVYFQNQKKYPEHIIYYRDGVSDGQFPIVKKNELSAIRAVCRTLRVQPKLTCIIVIKRHHTRFFPTRPNPRDKFNNVEPGTVVDQVIVHPNEVQFFMVSHQSIQGTAKPTRYNVIEDDAKMNIDDLQKLTYSLCHMFPRCNRVVSYPAPAYLAHLVAFRGRVYIEGTHRFGEPQREYERRLINTDFMQRNPMYFI